MITLGLTGSIAMGKTATARVFAELGCPVFDADAEVYKLYDKNGTAVAPIAERFPAAIRNGAVDRQILSGLLLDDRKALSDLENIVHPLVWRAEKAFAAESQAKGEKLIVFDIPLLYETGREKEFDYVAVVSVDAEEQRRRALSRPGMTVEKFRRIMDRQLPDAEKRERADFVIETDGFEKARLQVMAIVERLRAESS
jgi:dephospho-CoA kinase